MNHLRFVRPERNHLYFPRSAREAFGFNVEPLPERVTFTGRPRQGWLPLAAAVLLLAVVFVFFGAAK